MTTYWKKCLLSAIYWQTFIYTADRVIPEHTSLPYIAAKRKETNSTIESGWRELTKDNW